jgi:co-chaperonin GroES (HSP10)
MSFRPLRDRVVIRRLEGDENTKGGIIIPDTAKESRRKARLSPSDRAAGMRTANFKRSR